MHITSTRRFVPHKVSFPFFVGRAIVVPSTRLCPMLVQAVHKGPGLEVVDKLGTVYLRHLLPGFLLEECLQLTRPDSGTLVQVRHFAGKHFQYLHHTTHLVVR